MINIGYKNANRKENLCFSLEYLGYLILCPNNWSFLYIFDNDCIELLHIMHYSQRVLEIS